MPQQLHIVLLIRRKDGRHLLFPEASTAEQIDIYTCQDQEVEVADADQEHYHLAHLVHSLKAYVFLAGLSRAIFDKAIYHDRAGYLEQEAKYAARLPLESLELAPRHKLLRRLEAHLYFESSEEEEQEDVGRVSSIEDIQAVTGAICLTRA